MIIITAGRKYLDIDAYASMIAYRELLRVTSGEEVHAFSTTEVNQTVPPMLRDLKYGLDKPTPAEGAKFVLVDVSNPDFFDTFVVLDRVVEIIDHHAGYEDYWAERGAVKSQIEAIGAVCTQVYERFVATGRTELLDADLCRLLAAGILDNTINLKSKNTTARDREAYAVLLERGGLAEGWGREYFAACQAEQSRDLKGAILGDMKAEYVSPLVPEAIGQIILLDRSVLSREVLAGIFADFERWILNAICLEDGRSYLYASDAEVLGNIERLFGGQVSGENCLALDNFILRKEILKRAREA